MMLHPPQKLERPANPARFSRRNNWPRCGHRLHHEWHKSGRAIGRQDQLPLPGKATPPRNIPSDQAILLGQVANAHIGHPTLGPNPRRDLLRPTPPSYRPIQNLDARNSVPNGNLLPVLILVLHCKPAANSVAGRQA